MKIDVRNDAVCRACKEPITYDPRTAMRATNAESPLCLFVVCSKKCRKRVKNGDIG